MAVRACTGRPLQAPEDGVQVEGVGTVPTTLQAEIMSSGKKPCFVIVKKSLASRARHNSNITLYRQITS